MVCQSRNVYDKVTFLGIFTGTITDYIFKHACGSYIKSFWSKMACH